jgi:hypothetical protein
MYAARRLSSDLVFSTYARNPDLEEDSFHLLENFFSLVLLPPGTGAMFS